MRRTTLEEPASEPGRSVSLSGTNLERAGDYNRRVTLQAIRAGSATTKLDIAAQTGLTVPTISNIVSRLLDEGLIVETGRLRSGRGQPAAMFEINPNGCYAIGLNIDRDHQTMVLIDLAGQVRARLSQGLRLGAPEAVAAFVAEGWMEFGKIAAHDRIVGMGVAIPDDLTRVDLPQRPAPDPRWRDFDIRGLLSPHPDLAVFVENDAAAAALGERHFGHGLKTASFFYMLINSGLGGGLVVEGEYFRGAQGRSGEIGFLPVHSTSTPARTLQEVVSLAGLHAHTGLDVSTLGGEDGQVISPVLQQRIDDWIDLAAALLIDPVISISCLINPQAIYLGGRLPVSLVERLALRIDQLLSDRVDVLPTAPVRPAALASDAPAMGAAILPILDRYLPSRAALRNLDQRSLTEPVSRPPPG